VQWATPFQWKMSCAALCVFSVQSLCGPAGRNVSAQNDTAPNLLACQKGEIYENSPGASPIYVFVEVGIKS
jgi:hypothetical protein